MGGVVGGVLASTGSVVLASVFPSSKKQVMAAAKSGKGVLQVTAPPQPCECVCVCVWVWVCGCVGVYNQLYKC